MRFYLVIFLFFHSMMLGAHEIRPAYLEVKQVDSTSYEILWKVPVANDRVAQIKPIFPEGFKLIDEQIFMNNVAQIKKYKAAYTEDLAGKIIEIDRLDETLIDVFVQLAFLDQTSHNFILQASNKKYLIPYKASKYEVFASYFKLGFEHILEGYDHLLFVFAILLLLVDFWVLIKTITAFTIAHSITLAFASLGVFSLPGPPVEAVIALSIMFLAKEYLTVINGKKSLTAQYPWAISFAFGLLHGFGFAGALTEIGISQESIFVSLLSFNLGVETGQLAFVFIILILANFFKILNIKFDKSKKISAAYAVGGVGAFWFIDRLGGMFIW